VFGQMMSSMMEGSKDETPCVGCFVRWRINLAIAAADLSYGIVDN